MNSVDRTNLAAMNSSLQHGEPISLDTATGTATAAGMSEANITVDNMAMGSVPDAGIDNTVSNGAGGYLTPKPGTKYATEHWDDPIGVSEAVGSYNTEGSVDDATVSNTEQMGSVLTPKPGTKYAACPPDDFGAMGVDEHGDLLDDATVPNTNQNGSVLTPKPGTKYAACPPEDFGAMGVNEHGDLVDDATVPNTNQNGSVLTPKPGTKYAC